MSEYAIVTFNDIPRVATSLKYAFLGELALESHRRYCTRHGYDFLDQVEIDRSRPACWAKIAAVERALEQHDWVLWADSDTLISNASLRLEELADRDYDLIVQHQEAWWERIGLANGTERFPINSGVFLIKSSDWSRQFLRNAYAQEQFITNGAIWDGIGDQEAMNACIRADPEARRRIKYTQRLQTSPRLFDTESLLVHFYGNHATRRIPPDACFAVFERWTAAVGRGDPLPADWARFHWCCIQQHQDAPGGSVRDIDHFLYTLDDLEPPGEAGIANGDG